MSFAPQQRVKLYATNPLERVNSNIKRRTGIVGIFPSKEAITCLVGAILLEQIDEWAVRWSRYMMLGSVANLRDDPLVRLPAMGT